MGKDLQWSDVLDNLSEGVYIVDRDGNYTYGNSAFLKMAGGHISDLPKLNVFHEGKDSYEVKKSAARTAFQEKRRITMINNVSNFHGFRYRQLVSAVPVFDDMGEVDQVVVEMINLDILQKNLQKAIRVEDEDGIEWTYHEDSNVEVIAESPAMRGLLEQARELARVDSTILIEGETGTGKEVLANFIHNASRRRKKQMIAVNCAALPESLLESELFGYEKGAFTNASSSGKEGLVKAAHGGTLFLDEINSLPLALQGKLLRILETKRLKRVGATREEEVDFRLLVAANADLRKCVEEGTFRADLYYRIAVIPLVVPPLRMRKEDIEPLAHHFMRQYCQRYGKEKVIGNSAMKQLLEYDWPGNVRELKNMMEALVVMVSADTMEIRHLPDQLLQQNVSHAQPVQNEDFAISWSEYCEEEKENFSLQGYLEYCERAVLTEVIRTEGSSRKAAKVLGVDQSTIVRKKQKYGIG